MTAAEMAIAIVRVATLALIFGAGIPALFSLGMRAHAGNPVRNEAGEVIADAEASPQMKLLAYCVYAALALVIVVAIVWVAKDSIAFYFGWEPFGSLR
ncbi:MAG: hypothetical protein SPI77_00100 [Corynebacterium sp.]|nr:hypothetical protein [Corynebacterium sp.]